MHDRYATDWPRPEGVGHGRGRALSLSTGQTSPMPSPAMEAPPPWPSSCQRPHTVPARAQRSLCSVDSDRTPAPLGTTEHALLGKPHLRRSLPLTACGESLPAGLGTVGDAATSQTDGPVTVWTAPPVRWKLRGGFHVEPGRLAKHVRHADSGPMRRSTDRSHLISSCNSSDTGDTARHLSAATIATTMNAIRTSGTAQRRVRGSTPKARQCLGARSGRGFRSAVHQ